MTTIRNIIFDLGGVVLNIDPKLTVQTFESYGIADVASRYNFPHQVPLFDALEVGAIGEEAFRKGICKLFEKELSDADIDNAWNAMLLDFPEQRMESLKKLSKKYRIFLLSNTNSIHLKAYFAQLQHKFGVPDLSHIFEKEYYSHIEGLRKPDTALFNRVLSQNGLVAAETLFIDDAAINHEGAAACGIKSYHLHISDEELSDLFDTTGELTETALARVF